MTKNITDTAMSIAVGLAVLAACAICLIKWLKNTYIKQAPQGRIAETAELAPLIIAPVVEVRHVVQSPRAGYANAINGVYSSPSPSRRSSTWVDSLEKNPHAFGRY
jgi:hypothetical protein